MYAYLLWTFNPFMTALSCFFHTPTHSQRAHTVAPCCCCGPFDLCRRHHRSSVRTLVFWIGSRGTRGNLVSSPSVFFSFSLSPSVSVSLSFPPPLSLSLLVYLSSCTLGRVFWSLEILTRFRIRTLRVGVFTLKECLSIYCSSWRIGSSQ